MMTHFRKRFNASGVNDINDLLHHSFVKKDDQKNDKPDGDSLSGSDCSEENEGQLIVDASCAPADIHYPTDIALLNNTRSKKALNQRSDCKHKSTAYSSNYSG